LNDVELGGGTNFPSLDLTVQPKRGRALLWPSVMNYDLNSRDQRTEHQALPVEKGTKYAANGWIHLYDFVGALQRDCI
jgi:prolyl 4-hydroxylase